MNRCLHVAKNIFLVFFVFIFIPANGAVAKRLIIQPLVSEEDAAAGPGAKFRLAPQISASVGYDSNFFKNEDDEREVFTWLVQPGIAMEYFTAKSSVILGYSLDAYFYTESDDAPAGQKEIDDYDYVGHTLSFNAKTAPTSKLTLELDESFMKTRDDSKADGYVNDVTREKYYINRLTPGIMYRWNERFSSSVKYRNTLTRYSDADDADYDENRGLFDMRYYFSPTSSLALDYQVWDRSYDVEASDYTSNQIGMVYRRQTQYTGFEAGAGYHNRSFDADGRDSRDGFYYHLGMNAQMAKTTANIVFEENYNDSSNTADFFKYRRLGLNFGYTFGQYLSAGLSGFFQMNDYEDWSKYRADSKDREDDVFGISASLGYKVIEWVSLGLSTGYENRDSNLSGGYDYDNTYVIFKVDAVYDTLKR